MVQGTGSHAGKSVITAGLCRIFAQDGYKVAPFKSQNMALNSYPTEDGLEMGRAQVMQAEACGRKPEIEMNPILLKPSSDVGCQVIVMGKPFCNMNVKKYHRYQKKAWGIVQRAYNKLAKENDIIVIEGAGSPAEINLKKNDIVNMKVAKFAEAQVLLIGDIDRGGVFASLYGTLKLIPKNEQDLIKGIIINKFRGDETVLTPGLENFSKLIKKPILGVIPFFQNIRLDEEDSLALEDKPKFNKFHNRAGKIEVAVICLPHMSNFTDFDPIEEDEEIYLRYITTKEELGNPDVIIIPGTKNTMEDLKFLYLTNMADAIQEKAKAKVIIIGICGGYQILGKEVKDPYSVESNIKYVKGLGLLDVTTVIEKNKITCQSEAEWLYNFAKHNKNEKLKGYEIHMGRTTLAKETKPFLKIIKRSGRKVNNYDGAINKEGNVIGTYLHGILDNLSFRIFMKNLCKKEQCNYTSITSDFNKDEEYNKLANLFREHLDIPQIYKILI